MNRISKMALAGASAAAVLLAGCASTGYHYSQLTGQRHFRAPIDTYAVSVVRIDGKDNSFRPALVEPGLRKITVQGPPGGAQRIGEERTIALEIAPCTRYFLVAVRPNPIVSDFSVRVDYQEPVGGCTAPRPS